MSMGTLVEKEMTREELVLSISSYDVLVTRLSHHIDREIIEAGDKLRFVVTPTTGLDHLDVDLLEEKGIKLICLKGETRFLRTITATAEHTWGLLLALIRNIPSSVSDVHNGYWRRDLFRGVELTGKCLGIVGYGRIGKIVARYGMCFGMDILAYDPYETEFESGVEAVPFSDLLAKSDFITLHIPLNKETVGMFDSEVFQQMKKGCYLLNTSRGALIHEEALIEQLERGRLAGAAVDVVSNEICRKDDTISSPMITYARNHSNLIITPHIGGATLDSMWKTEVFVAQKLKKLFGNVV